MIFLVIRYLIGRLVVWLTSKTRNPVFRKKPGFCLPKRRLFTTAVLDAPSSGKDDPDQSQARTAKQDAAKGYLARQVQLYAAQ